MKALGRVSHPIFLILLPEGIPGRPTNLRSRSSRKVEAVLASNQNIENNPMQSSKMVTGMDALSDPAKIL
jgi:hypothetical protein